MDSRRLLALLYLQPSGSRHSVLGRCYLQQDDMTEHALAEKQRQLDGTVSRASDLCCVAKHLVRCTSFPWESLQWDSFGVLWELTQNTESAAHNSRSVASL